MEGVSCVVFRMSVIEGLGKKELYRRFVYWVSRG